MSRGTARESSQDKYVRRDSPTNGEETDDVAGALARGGNGFDIGAWRSIVVEVDDLTGGGINGLTGPYTSLGQRALELVGSFGLPRTMSAFREAATAVDHPDARQVVTGANSILRPFIATGRAKPLTKADREQAEVRAQIDADMARAGIRRREAQA